MQIMPTGPTDFFKFFPLLVGKFTFHIGSEGSSIDPVRESGLLQSTQIPCGNTPATMG